VNLPEFDKKSFAKTNLQTIAQRVGLIRELLPFTSSIAELCCGDCEAQARAYAAELSLSRFRGLDISPVIVERNRAKGIECCICPKTTTMGDIRSLYDHVKRHR